MVRMTKGLSIIEKFVRRHSAIAKSYTDSLKDLTLPVGFKPTQVIKLEKDNRSLLLVALDAEKFHITRLSAIEIANIYTIELSSELKGVGLKEI